MRSTTLATALVLTLSALLLASCGGSDDSSQPSSATAAGSTSQTDTNVSNPSSRRVYFGDLHDHTKYSVDAYVFGNTQNGPAEAYAFAKGGTIDLGPIDPATPVNPVRLRRPLDFLAVTDHSEGFGLSAICTDPKSAGYNSPECLNLRSFITLPLSGNFVLVVSQLLSPLPLAPLVCSQPGVNCATATASVWGDIQRAAAAANDPGHFTSFVAYEWSATPGNANLHRNVIFANDKVPAKAISYTDTGIPDVTKLWSQLQAACKDGVPGCDVLTIAHNSNVSMGLMFTDPKTADEARKRQIWEPLVEMHQHKGASECRFDKHFNAGVDTTDEDCAFEQVPTAGLIYPTVLPDAAAAPPIVFNKRSFVRSVLKDGLAIEQRGTLDTSNGLTLAHVNPFKLGFVGGTDTHNTTPGNTDSKGWKGHIGVQDSTNALRVGSLAGITRSPGGLTAVWAESNTRPSIFASLRRRETYGTSGTRPLVRFFGGWNYNSNLCSSQNLIATAYAQGVPMGSDMPARPNTTAVPHFIVWAQQDAGTTDEPGTPLQRLQIVKGWVDATGGTHEQVFDAAGSAPSRAVNPNTCEAEQTGSAELCSVWQDPAFDPAQRAVYYVRVLEEPTCRWHVSQCRALGTDPFSASCDTSSNNPNSHCCAEVTDPVVQQRAWASPIWYGPGS